MRTGLIVTTPPATEPVTLAEIKDHLRIDGANEDAALTMYRKAARVAVEAYQNRTLITTSLQYTMEAFPVGEIVLPRPPLIGIVGSGFQYVDAAGDTQTWAAANYQEDTNIEPGRVKPVSTGSYPTIKSDTYNAVTITYTAGYGTDTTDVPESTRLALIFLVAHYHENREPVAFGTPSEIPLHIRSLLDAEKVPIVQ